MRRITSLVSAAAVIMAMCVPQLASANAAAYPHGGGNKAEGEKIFKEGKGTVPACNSCHGPEGLGDDNMGTPRIAGQFYTFLRKQLEDFATDKRTDSTMFIMNANAKGLTPEDRDNVATYLTSLRHESQKTFKGSNLEEVAAAGQPVGQTNKGKSLVEWGQGQRGIPACKACHSYNGMGTPPIYPMIGRQRYVYLVNQLKNWRSGARANDPMGQMRAVASKMTDDDIINAAAYLTNASPNSPGNRFTAADH